MPLFAKKKDLCCFLGNLFDIDLKSVADSLVSSVVKKRPDKSLIKQKVALVVRKWRNGLKLKCKLKVWREEVEASAEDEVKDADPPIEGRCKSPSNPSMQGQNCNFHLFSRYISYRNSRKKLIKYLFNWVIMSSILVVTV